MTWFNIYFSIVNWNLDEYVTLNNTILKKWFHIFQIWCIFCRMWVKLWISMHKSYHKNYSRWSLRFLNCFKDVCSLLEVSIVLENFLNVHETNTYNTLCVSIWRLSENLAITFIKCIPLWVGFSSYTLKVVWISDYDNYLH